MRLLLVNSLALVCLFAFLGCGYWPVTVMEYDSDTSIGEDIFHVPIDNFWDGITKKSFGIYVSPENSSVTPEKFRGYHTGVDVEVSQDDADVPVYALMDGEVIYLDWVSGYGGVIIISFEYNSEIYTALYGHINLDSADLRVGDFVEKGERLASLGKGFSVQTDFERKHLHFGIHKGGDVEFKGYVQNEDDLSMWIDPVEFYDHNLITLLP